MYIGAYNLTFRRVLAFWMLCYTAAVLVFSFVRLEKKEFPLLAVCAVTFIVWYLVLNAVDLSALYGLAF